MGDDYIDPRTGKVWRGLPQDWVELARHEDGLDERLGKAVGRGLWTGALWGIPLGLGWIALLKYVLFPLFGVK